MNPDPYTHKAKERKVARQEAWMASYNQVHSIDRACQDTGIPLSTFERWRANDQSFRTIYEEAAKTKQAYLRRNRTQGKDAYGLLYDHLKPLPPKGTFAEFRRHYLGRPVSAHQLEFIEAYEDESNLVIFNLGPPGSGKDTTAGDLLLYELPDNRDLRCAWIMRGEQFAARRVKQRLDPYLTDTKRYLHAPDGPDTTVPAANLIEDYGPFKYRQGMVDAGGKKLEATTWNGNEIYFLTVGAPEADPNLWATGVGGQLYGARVDRMVMSDIFDRENQRSVTMREDQFSWIMGTVKSRLDTKGRLIFLGTRCLPGDNYERLMDAMIGDAAVVYQGRHYTKYANGVATVIIPAIEVDEFGEEQSFWPEAFPLDNQFELPDGSWIPDPGGVASETVYRTLVADGTRVTRVRGLRALRAEAPALFDTMYQQRPPAEITGDFTDPILDAADDPERTLGRYRPRELLVVGVDPARSAGAAWVTWGVDREAGTVTLIDFFYGENLGIRGIKNQLVVKPVTAYEPVWFCYEVNMEGAILEDPEIRRVFDDFGVNVYAHRTHHGNRRSTTIGVPAMSFYMRSAVIRWPTMTAADRGRMAVVKEHFKTWDRKDALTGTGVSRHLKGFPDDIAMAAWIGFTKALELLNKARPGAAPKAMPVPRQIRDRWDRFQQGSRERRYVKEREGLRQPAPDLRELVSIVLGESDASDSR